MSQGNCDRRTKRKFNESKLCLYCTLDLNDGDML